MEDSITETTGWSTVSARINSRYTTAWWAMAYANNPIWAADREGLGSPNLEPIGLEACLSVLAQWPPARDLISTGTPA